MRCGLANQRAHRGADGAGDGDQNEALVTALGKLMESSGPDNFVFNAARQTLATVQRRPAGAEDSPLQENGHAVAEEKCAQPAAIVSA